MADRTTSTLGKLTLTAVVEEYNDLVEALGATGVILHEEEIQTGEDVTEADSTDLATGIVLGNALKVAVNLHLLNTDKHPAADATNTVGDADASNQATLDTLLTNMKADFNAHQILAASHRSVGQAGAVTAAPIAIATAASTDLATSIVLGNAIKAAYNIHLKSGAQVIALSGN